MGSGVIWNRMLRDRRTHPEKTHVLLSIPSEPLWSDSPVTETVEVWDNVANSQFTIQGQNLFLALLTEEEMANLKLHSNSFLDAPGINVNCLQSTHELALLET